MITRQQAIARSIAVGMSAAGIVVSAACHQAPPPTVLSPPALPMQQPMSEPAGLSSALSSPLSADTASEVRVDIDTHGAEIDVRQALAFLADKGKLSLVFSPEINKKVRLQLHDVPVSQALAAVLASAGLTLENMNAPTTTAPTSSVVFYQLPVNVDSLSVEAIMKRFGVGRTAAELIVQSRVNKP
jgi:hypothetical protein